MMSKMFIETSISLKLLIDNDLKRKQRCSTNESHLLSMIITFENTILNHLVKKSKTNELKSTLITSISISSFLKILQEKQAHYRCSREHQTTLNVNFNVSAKEALNTTVQRSQVQRKDDDNTTT